MWERISEIVMSVNSILRVYVHTIFLIIRYNFLILPSRIRILPSLTIFLFFSPNYIIQKHYLGPCSKIHAEELRAEYEKVKLTKNYGYEEEALAFISPMIHDCDRKITKAKMRVF